MKLTYSRCLTSSKFTSVVLAHLLQTRHLAESSSALACGPSRKHGHTFSDNTAFLCLGIDCSVKCWKMKMHGIYKYKIIWLNT